MGLGLRVLVLGFVKFRQVVEARGHVGVLRAQDFFPDRQRPLKRCDVPHLVLESRIKEIVVASIDCFRWCDHAIGATARRRPTLRIIFIMYGAEFNCV
jgi:hypothetical protein